MVDFLNRYRLLTGIAHVRLLCWLGLSPRKFGHWKDRYGKANEHNAMIPRDHWIEPWERTAILDFARQYPLEGYRRLTFMMLDRDVAAVCPATTYRVLKAAGVIGARNLPPTRKGQGFVQPLQPHEHWHVDFSYVNIGGTFTISARCSTGLRAPSWHRTSGLRWRRATRRSSSGGGGSLPQARPRIITDNGPQSIARDFEEFFRLWQTTHVLCSPHYPQSNGKLERYHRTLKEQAIRPKTPLTLEDAKRIVGDFIDHYNAVRLHAGIGYIAPNDRLAGHHTAIFANRDKKLETARENRRVKRQQQTALVA